MRCEYLSLEKKIGEITVTLVAALDRLSFAHETDRLRAHETDKVKLRAREGAQPTVQIFIFLR